MKKEGGFKSYEKYSNDVGKGQPPIKIESYKNPNYEEEISRRNSRGWSIESSGEISKGEKTEGTGKPQVKETNPFKEKDINPFKDNPDDFTAQVNRRKDV